MDTVSLMLGPMMVFEIATIVESGISSFPVTIGNASSFSEAALEVAERIKLFCFHSVKGGECEVQTKNRQVNLTRRDTRHSIGSDIEYRIEFLLSEEIREEEDAGGSVVLVGMTVFRHSNDALKEINRIKNAIKGDINQTNRKWRRKLNADKA